MAEKELRIYAPTAILGYGYPASSLEAAMRMKPHAIAVDGGSTDGGPYYLGIEPGIAAGGQTSAFMQVLSRDIGPLLEASVGAKIPLLIGSAGFAGADLHLMGALGATRNEAEARNLHFKLAVIHAEIDKEYVRAKIRAHQVEPLGPVPELTEDEVDQSVRIVGQMGVHPFVHALEAGAEVVLAGRANDPSMFAALPLMHGFDQGLALHMAKILECGAIAAEPGSGTDGLLGTLQEDGFILEPVSEERRCTTLSVAAHSLYEKSDPTKLFGPGGYVDLSKTRFEQIDNRRVRVSGSRFVPQPHKIKLEGSKHVGFRTIAIFGVRDPAVIANLDSILEVAKAEALGPASEDCQLLFQVYGRDGVMGALEPYKGAAPHEVGIVVQAIGADQGTATSICGVARSILLHHGFAGRVSTAGNIASPFSPLDIPAGPVYEFNIYHLVDESDPLALFPMDLMDV
jgi:hypothetical protein